MSLALELAGAAIGRESEIMPTYLMPIAQHQADPVRLLLRGDNGHLYLWQGDDMGDVEETTTEFAAWLLERGWVRPLDPVIWLHTADLPLAPRGASASTNP